VAIIAGQTHVIALVELAQQAQPAAQTALTYVAAATLAIT